MKIKSHRDGRYSITDLTTEELRDIESSLYSRGVDFDKASRAVMVPSGYQGWTIEQYHSINADIAKRHFEMAATVAEVAWRMVRIVEK